MAFAKKTWKDRIAEFPTRRRLTKEDNTSELVTVAREEGTLSQEGDAFSAENMNDLENRIDAEFTEVNGNLDKKLSFAAINSGGSLSANTAKEFSISNVVDIIFYFLNYGGKYYTLTSLLNTDGCCTNGIITINYTYNTNTKILTVKANVSCAVTGIYGLV